MLNDASLRHVFVLSDGLHVNGSDLARGLAGGVRTACRSLAAFPGTAPTSPRPGSSPTIPRARSSSQRRVVRANTQLRIGYASMGGWEPFGPLRTITRAEGNILYELDGRSALDLYKSYLGSHAEQLPSSALLFPIHLVVTDAKGSEGVVRTVLSVDEREQVNDFRGRHPSGWNGAVDEDQCLTIWSTARQRPPRRA